MDIIDGLLKIATHRSGRISRSFLTNEANLSCLLGPSETKHNKSNLSSEQSKAKGARVRVQVGSCRQSVVIPRLTVTERRLHRSDKESFVNRLELAAHGG